MKKLFIGAVIGFSFAVTANPFKSSAVDVSIEVIEGTETFHLVCKPKLSVSKLPNNWVDTCNDIGKKLLELAVENGVKVEVNDKVFGLAGDFVQQASIELADNIIPQEIKSPLFGD